jgi:hypothetical protein
VPTTQRPGEGYSLGLIPQLVWFSFPDGEGVRGDQVNREIPGMRGRTTNQRIRNPT